MTLSDRSGVERDACFASLYFGLRSLLFFPYNPSSGLSLPLFSLVHILYEHQTLFFKRDMGPPSEPATASNASVAAGYPNAIPPDVDPEDMVDQGALFLPNQRCHLWTVTGSSVNYH